jgi:type I restriction enzyme, S subunit
MIASQNNIPKLRFPEFSDGWKVSRLGEVAEKITDGTHDTPKPVEKGIPFLTAIHIKDGFVDYENCYYLREEVHNSIYKRCNPEKDDLLIVNIGAGTATCALNTVDYEFSLKNVALVKPNKKIIDGKFLSQVQREKSSKIFIQLSSGGAQPFLSLKEIGKLKITFPTLPEQQKIATFLSTVDEKLQALKKKKSLLETYKKGVMQKLFSQQIRFKDENGEEFGEWEVKTLGEVMIEGKLGGNYENSESNTGIPVIKMGNIGRGVVNKDKLQNLPDNEFYDEDDILKVGDLLFNTRNTLELVGKVAIWRNELPFALYNSNLMRLKFNNSIENSNRFMNYLFNTKDSINQLRSFATGTTSVAAIYGRDLKNFVLTLPCVEEQTKIANFLSAIDEKINKVDAQIKQTELWKKGLLQGMFV